MEDEESDLAEILFVGTYPPRECGIATFTRDLSSAIEKKFYPSIRSKILAMNKNGINIYNYPEEVMFQISDTEIEDYVLAAEKVNKSDSIKLVCIQHEFGIFGGECGEYLIEFLKKLNKPSIITFHSVIPSPNEKMKKVVQEIAKYVKNIIVMNSLAIDILRKNYQVDCKIEVISHGIPTVAFSAQNKKKLGFEDRIVLSSFGMLSSGKGYENVIEALPKIIRKFPNLLYLIVGETHPVVQKKEGEQYRNYLEKRVKELGILKNVKFYNKYVTLGEIVNFICASDIYISSSKDPNQITSGTLSYAMGCGRAIISTPFLHALEVVKKDNGELVEFDNPDSFAEAINKILSDVELRKNMEKNNYACTRKMTWPNVALSYKKIFDKHIEIPEKHEIVLPKIKVFHLKNMTDEFGIIQFSNYLKPDKNSGYTLDDNARALIASTMLYDKFRTRNYLVMTNTFLNYIQYVQNGRGRLYNLVNKNKKINFKNFSEEAHGRAVRALGFVVSNQAIPKKLRKKAEAILLRALPICKKFKSPRAIASVIIGLYYYNKENYSNKNVFMIKNLSDFLVKLYENRSHDGWHWFEPYLTYSNSKLSEALFYSYIATQDKRYLEVGTLSLNFLISKTFNQDMFIPIGQDGWYSKNDERAYHDQQPLDAASMVLTLGIAGKVLNNPIYNKYTFKAFQWFLGKNILNQMVYNEATGGCHDGLGKTTINMNQGAESTLAYLIARLSLSNF